MNKAICFAALFLAGTQAFAEETITVTVKAKDKRCAAIGFSVEHKNSGTLGKNYSGKGPKNKVYKFGYKLDSIFGDNVYCGSLVLTQDSVVHLVWQDGKCQSILG